MVRLLQNHIGGPNKIFVDFTDYGQKLHGTVSDSVILSVSEISLFEQVKNDIIDFSCNIGNDCFVIIFIADFRRKNFYYKAQIIGSFHPDNQVGHTDFISEIDHTGQDFLTSPYRSDFVAHIIVVVPELNWRTTERFNYNFIALLFIEERNCPIFTQTSGTDDLLRNKLGISFQVDFIRLITEHFEKGLFLTMLRALIMWMRGWSLYGYTYLIRLDVYQFIRASMK